MRLKQLHYFKVVAECGSFTEASNRLYISHQSLSYAVNKLEKDFNIKLFERTSKGVLLTDNGKEFLVTTNKILSLYEELENSFKGNGSELSGELKISIPKDIENYFFTSIQYNALKRFPSLNVKVFNTPMDELISNLENKHIDIALIGDASFCTMNRWNFSEDLICVPLFNYYYVVKCNKNNAISRQKNISIKTLLKRKIVWFEKSLFNSFDNSCMYSYLSQYENFSPILISTEKMISKLLYEDDAVIVSINTSNQYCVLDSEILIPLPNEFKGKMCAVIHKDNLENELVQSYLNLIRTIKLDMRN